MVRTWTIDRCQEASEGSLRCATLVALREDGGSSQVELRDHSVRTVTASFDGSGDDGSIQNIDYGDASVTPASILVEVDLVHRSFNGHEWTTNRVLERMNPNDAIEAVTSDYLAETGVDWYNNDGGFGELVIDVAQGSVALEVNLRYTESSTEYACTKDIGTGEELDE